MKTVCRVYDSDSQGKRTLVYELVYEGDLKDTPNFDTLCQDRADRENTTVATERITDNFTEVKFFRPKPKE